jgi:hypothetical protein
MNEDIRNLIICYMFIPLMALILIFNKEWLTKGLANLVVLIVGVILIYKTKLESLK